MRTAFFIFACLVFTTKLFGQGEEIGPLTANPDIANKKTVLPMKAAAGTFDSTFIYFPDTLNLPFFDEFSKDHFQKYNATYTDPGVTSDKKYRILDNGTLLPIPNNVFLTGQQTYRRTYDVTSNTQTDANFTATPYKVGDLSSYPVNYVTTNLYPPYYIYDTIGVPDVSDTVWIVDPEYFQDSATQFFIGLNDPNAYWLDNYAYRNYRFAYQPRSLGVVTFDGLDENGYPYAIGTTLTNYADYLTSKPLNLAPYTDADSIYFSFLVQPEGFGDVPEASDSLVLEFYAKDLDQWFRVWSMNGGARTPFKAGHIKLSDPKYFKKGFQFRFKNYGALSGSLDHFHLDYVHLRTNSQYNDTLFVDFAFSYPVGSLLKTYTSVPWDHFKNNPSGKMNDNFKVDVYNGSVVPANSKDGKVEIFYNALFEGRDTLYAQLLCEGDITSNYQPRKLHTSYHDLSTGYVFDNSKPGNYQSFDLLATATVQYSNLPQNDSTTGVQFFSNYYSYDDGTAEAAYGPTGSQARLAIRYNAYEADSLIGLSMHFVPSVNDVSNKLFVISVWANNGGVPGSLLYEDNVFFPRSPIYSNERNGFINYYFKDTMKVAVGTTYFVGWRQFDSDRLNIGLDRNIDRSSNTLYSVNGGVSWNTSSIPGSVMIRPIYSTGMDAELGVEKITPQPRVTAFPNPTNDQVYVKVENSEFTGLEVYSIQGQMIINSDEAQFSLRDHPQGIYFIKLNGIPGVVKIVKQ